MWSSYQFTFTGANQIELEDGVYYDAVLIFEGGDASNYIYVNVNSKNYYLGNAGYYDGSWHAYSNSYDLYSFYVYGIGAHNLISNGNDVVCDYLDLSLSSASGGIFYAGLNSTDSGDNEGWIFGSPANDSRSSVSFGGDGRYVEDFSTTTKKDAGNTTASWTGDGTAEMT